VVAHRGAPERIAENTLASFHAAVALGADAVELDVRVSADGEPVVFHDASFERMTGRSGLRADTTLAQLRGLRVDTSHAIPTLVEALDLLRGRCEVYLDLKPAHVSPQIVAQAVLGAVARVGVSAADVVLLAEDVETLAAARARLAILRTVPHLFSLAAPPAGCWAVSVEDAAVPAEQVVARARPARALVWTVNESPRMTALAQAGADAIVTDRPDLLGATLISPALAA